MWWALLRERCQTIVEGEWAQTELIGLAELRKQSWEFGDAKVAGIWVMESEKMDLDRKRTPEIYRGVPLNFQLINMDVWEENTWIQRKNYYKEISGEIYPSII